MRKSTSGDANELVVIQKSDWRIVRRVRTRGKMPDGVWVDTAKHLLLVASDAQNWVETYNTGPDPTLRRISRLEPKTPKVGPDVGVLVQSSGVLYMPDDATVEALDVDTGRITNAMNTQIP